MSTADQDLAYMASVRNALLRTRETENKKIAAREKYLGDAGGVSRHVADLVAPMLPPNAKTNKSKFAGEAPHMAVDDSFPEDHPMRGVGQEVMDVSRRLEGVKLKGNISGQKLVNDVFKEVAGRRLQDAYAYNRKQETSYFGKDVGMLPGYDQYKAEEDQKAAEGRDWGAIAHGVTPKGLATNAAVLTGMNVAAEGIGQLGKRMGWRFLAKAAGRGLFGLPAVGPAGIATKVGGLALMGLAEFAAADAAFEIVGQSKWARARTDEPLKVMGAELLAGGAAAGAASKILKMAGLGKVAKQEAEAMLNAEPTGTNLVLYGKAARREAFVSEKAKEAVNKFAKDNPGWVDDAKYSAYEQKEIPMSIFDRTKVSPDVKAIPETTAGSRQAGSVVEAGAPTEQKRIGLQLKLPELPTGVDKAFGSTMNRMQKVTLNQFYNANPGARNAVIALGDNVQHLDTQEMSALHRFFADYPGKKVPASVIKDEVMRTTVNREIERVGSTMPTYKKMLRSLDTDGLNELSSMVEQGVAPEIGIVQAYTKAGWRAYRATVEKEVKHNAEIVARFNAEALASSKASANIGSAVQKGEVFTREEVRRILKDSEGQVESPVALLEKGSSVEATTKDIEVADIIAAVGDKQRGLPERIMESAQMKLGGGVYGYTLEHTGDLIHRMSHHAKYGAYYSDIVLDKIKKVLRTLEQPYGFEKEMKLNLKNNGVSLQEAKRLGKKYADAHKELTPLNKPQRLAQEASIALGEHRFKDTIKSLKELKGMVESGEFEKQAGIIDAVENIPVVKSLEQQADDILAAADAEIVPESVAEAVLTPAQIKAERFMHLKELAIANKRQKVVPKTVAFVKSVEDESLRKIEEETANYFKLLAEDPVAAADYEAIRMMKKASLVIPLAALVVGGMAAAPQDADASVWSKLAGKVSMAAAEKVAKATGKTSEELVKEIKKTSWWADKGTVLGKVKQWMDVEVQKPSLDDIIKSVKSDKAGVKTSAPKWVRDLVMTPAAVASLFYKEGRNPFVELAMRITATYTNMDMHKQAVKEILDLVPGYKAATKEVRVAMKPLIEKWEEKQTKVAWHQGNHDKLKAALKKMSQKADPVGYAEFEAQVKKSGEEYTAAAKEFAPFKAEWEATVRELAAKHSSSRIALALEDTADFKYYPWLKEMLSGDELAAVNALKDLNLTTKARIVEAGGNVIERRPFAHHALHPDSNKNRLEELIGELTPNIEGGIALSRLNSRAVGSKMMMPEVSYMYDRYIPDVERRIQVMKFWQKGKEGGWDAHVKELKANNMYHEQLESFWDHTKKIFEVPPGSQADEWARRYYSFEVAWRLFGSASVGFKHLMKQTAQLAMYPLDVWSKGVGGAPRLLYENRMRVLKEKWPVVFGDMPATHSDMAQLMKAWTHQGDMARALAEADMFDAPRNIFDRQLDKFNKVGSLMVSMVESFDRGSNFMMAMEMAARKGMTPAQANYAVMDAIIKANFLSGVQNPAWVRNPKARAFFMFQGTPFKLFEQRVLLARKAGKDILKATGVTWEQYKEFRAGLKEGEFHFKHGLILDALTHTRDIFDQSVTTQFMKYLITMGGVIWMGDQFFNSDIHDQVFHLPFLKTNKGSGPPLMLNPIMTGAYKAWGQRHDSDTDWMLLEALNNWSGSNGPVPSGIAKLIRSAKDDIPEMYNDTPWRYFMGIKPVEK